MNNNFGNEGLYWALIALFFSNREKKQIRTAVPSTTSSNSH